MSVASPVTLPVAAKPVGEALAIFCKRPASETVEELFGPEAVQAIRNAPTAARMPPRDPLRTLLALMAIAVIVASVFLPISQVASLLIALLAFGTATVAGRPWIEYWRGCLWNRRERTRAELAALTGNAVFKRNIQALEEFRRHIGNGTLRIPTIARMYCDLMPRSVPI